MEIIPSINKHPSGIYRIYNSINNKCYIGSTTNLVQRLRSHFCQLESGQHPIPEMQEDFTNNPDAFKYEVLEEIPRWHHDELLLSEGTYIKLYDSFHKGYNRTEGRTEPPLVMHRVQVSKEKASQLFLKKYVSNAQFWLESREMRKLCKLLDCQPGDLMEWVPDGEREK